MVCGYFQSWKRKKKKWVLKIKKEELWKELVGRKS